MCLALYLAAAQPLAVIPWDSAHPDFHVLDLPPGVAVVCKHFHYQHVYYAGSQQGCSCAFNYEHEFDAILQLRNYLRGALAVVPEIEAFACRAGREDHDAKHALRISPEGIALPDFLFKDSQFLVIRSGRHLRGEGAYSELAVAGRASPGRADG